MNKFLVALTFLGASSIAFSQASDNSSTVPGKYQFYVGPYVNVKLGVNPFVVDPLNGRVPAGVKVNPDFGITSYFPLNQNRTFGAALDLGYMTYKYKHNPSDDFLPAELTGKEPDESQEVSESYSYINVSPYLNIWGFTLGLNLGFPMSAEATNGNDSIVNPLYQYYTAEDILGRPEAYSPKPDVTKYLKTVMELRLGGMINVFENQMGRVNINLQAGYVFSGLYTDPADYQWGREYTFTQNGSVPANPTATEGEDSLNPKPVSFSIGLSYLFTLPPM